MKVPTAGVFRAHAGEVLCVSVSPCGELVASGSSRGEILLWAVETRRVIFRLPPECCHKDKGLLQVAWFPEGFHSAPSGRGVPSGAEFMTMGRDGCIRFWGVRRLGSGGGAVRLSDVLKHGGGAAGRAAVASCTPSESTAAPRLPPAGADYGDFAFVSRPTQDMTFLWGDGEYEVRCAATLYHSSFSFCKAALCAPEAGRTGVLLVPSDTEELVRVYQLWGAEDDVPVAWRGKGRMHKKDNPVMTEILEHAEKEQAVLNGGNPDAAAPTLAVDDIFLADLPPRCGGEVLKSGTPMACDAAFLPSSISDAAAPASSFLCGVGYESGHVLLHVFPCASGGDPTQLAIKPHGEVVLTVQFTRKSAEKLILATGGADNVITLHGLHVPCGGSIDLAPLRTVTLTKPGTAALSFHPLNPRLLCAGCWDAKGRVIDVKTGAVLAVLEEHAKTVSACTWVRGPGGTAVLLTAGNDSLVALWDVYADGA
eukprot:TRINITY_DN6258_c0_g2_i1.p1 TRINITY_DN6258_c0_g2~~TRINITY_DN6258_c0_g2_i1.p1  ORF type:complete len:481 (+),score=123.56 TRINITY_DN6258_c0_g2_i1:49-1491(+)